MIKVFIKTVIENVIGKLFTGVGPMESEYNNRNLYQQSGVSSIPKEGDHAIVIKQGNNYACIATDTPQGDRPILTTPRDICIYSSNGDFIKINGAGGKIEITSSTEINIKSLGTVNIEGNGTPNSINIGGGTLKSLVTADVLSILEVATMPVAGAIAGPYVTGTFTTPPGNKTIEVQGS